MTAGIAHHLVSRAVDVTRQHYKGDNGLEPGKELVGWAILMLPVATVVLYVAVLSMISYTYGDVVGTLTMIETPTAAAYKIESTDSDEIDAPLLSEDQKSEKSKLIEADLFLVKEKPITSKIRTTLKHLRAQAGPLARFRGLHVSIIYHLIHGSIVGLIGSSLNYNPIARPFIAVFASVALCRLQMTWTHIVISNPSTKSWIRRIPARTAARNILLPTAVFAIAEQAAVCVPGALFALAAKAFKEEVHGSVARAQNIALLEIFLIGLIGVGIFVLVVIPADVALKRVQASMLPEEDESIVPFHRAFAGKVKPEILGGSGAVSMLDAWKSFDRSARIRLMKLYLKVFLVSVLTTIMFVMVLAGEFRLILGDKFHGLAAKAHESLQQMQAGNPMI